MSLIVQKYGGTSVGSTLAIANVARSIAAVFQQGHQLVIVVSAMGQQTDELLSLAKELHPDPPQRELDMLLSSGERVSMSLLAIALHKLSIPTVSLTGSQSGILTDGTHGNARIRDILGDRIRKGLKDGKVVIVAGFQGVSVGENEITTLGRGGSDLTAIALAHCLKASKCQIFKDVDGVFSSDPRVVPHTQLIKRMSWDSLSSLTWFGSQVVHNRGVHLAKKYRIPLEIRSSTNLQHPGTIINERIAVEGAIVYAITHRHSLVWLKLQNPEVNSLGKILSILYAQGEYPVYFQQVSSESSYSFDLVASRAIIDKTSLTFQDNGFTLTPNSSKKELASISIVGDGFWQDSSILTSISSSLVSDPILIESKNSIVTVILEADKLNQNLISLHQSLIADKNNNSVS